MDREFSSKALREMIFQVSFSSRKTTARYFKTIFFHKSVEFYTNTIQTNENNAFIESIHKLTWKMSDAHLSYYVLTV